MLPFGATHNRVIRRAYDLRYFRQQIALGETIRSLFEIIVRSVKAFLSAAVAVVVPHAVIATRGCSSTSRWSPRSG
jgi:hypothetical protein